jgi:hypothetical protein
LDRAAYLLVSADDPPTCAQLTERFQVFTSDFAVADAEPPDTYEQCRQGGWVKYGYASHAQCNDGVHEYARRKCIFERAGIGITAFRAKYGLNSNGDYAMRHCVRLRTGF